MSVRLRPLAAADSAELAELYRDDREFLRTWEPDEPDEFFTPAGQQAAIASTLEACRSGSMLAWVIVADGSPVGRINLGTIVLGSLRSCAVGYWVAQCHAGRGIATSAVALALDVAFDELDLHRVDAFVRVDNQGSRRVLEKNGFRTVGVSLGHLHVGGRWRDELYVQKLAPWDDGVQLEPGHDVSTVGES